MILDNLLEPQKNHVKKLVDSIYTNGYSVDMSDMGCGKTYVASAIVKNLNIPVVVVCPKISIHTWGRVLKEFGIKAHLIINYEKLMRGGTPYLTYDKKLYVNSFHWESHKGMKIHFPKDALIVIDEAHKCRGQKSHNSRFLVSLKNHGYKFHLISATIATNPLDMRAFGYATNLHNGRDFRKFVKNAGGYDDGFGGLKVDVFSDKTQNEMKFIHNTLFNLQTCASRMTIKEFGNIFPKNIVTAEMFDMGDNNSKIQKVYDEMDAELAKLDDRIKNYSEHVFAIIMAARRKIELLKVPTAVELIEDWYNNKISSVVFLNFTDSIDAVIQRLNNLNLSNQISKIIGGQTEKERQKEISDFNSDKKRIMIAAVKAGNASISLHDLNGDYPRNTIISPSFSAIDMEQCLGRCARANGKTIVHQTFLYATNGIEETIAYKVNEKMKTTGILNDGDLMPDVGIFR